MSSARWMRAVPQYVRLYLFGSRGHGIMHRGSFGGSAIGVSQYALKYRHAPGDSGLLCGGFAENKFTDWASLPGVNCKHMGTRRILPRLLE